MKKNTFILLSLLTTLVIFWSCKDVGVTEYKPEICFDYTTENTELGFEVQFNVPCTSNSSVYTWNYGDGTKGTGLDPKHTYTEDGEYVVELEVVNNVGKNTLSKTITVVSLPIIEHIGSIETDEVWRNTAIHLIKDDVNVGNATLTIKPGTFVRFMPGKSLNIGFQNSTSATLIANGTTEEPILFTSAKTTKAKGDWGGVNFGPQTHINSSISNAILEYGGNNAIKKSMLSVTGGQVSIDHNQIRESSQYGINAMDGGGFISFTNNTIENCGLVPIRMEANWIHTLGEDNIFEGQEIEVVGDISQRNVRWRKQTIPYFIKGGLAIGSVLGSTLTIAAGSQFRFGENAEINVGWELGMLGSIIAEGTETEPILFTSAAEVKKAGDWKSIFFGAGTLSTASMNFCTLEYGGGFSDSHGIISLNNAQLALDHCRIRQVLYSGITLRGTSGFVSCTNNTFEGIKNYSLVINPNWVHTIGVGNNFIDKKPILIRGGEFTNLNSTWLQHTAAYRVENCVYIMAADTARLKIEAGTRLEFMQEAALVVSTNSKNWGQLIADGTGSPIVFTSTNPSGSAKAGDWDGIYFGHATAIGSLLKNCIIQYAGSYYEEMGAVLINARDKNLTVSGCSILDSEYAGICKRKETEAVIEGNSIERFGKDAITTLDYAIVDRMR